MLEGILAESNKDGVVVQKLQWKLERSNAFVDGKLRELEESIERRCRGFGGKRSEAIRNSNRIILYNPEAHECQTAKPNNSKKLRITPGELSIKILPTPPPPHQHNTSSPVKQQSERERSKKDQLIYIYQNMLSKIVNVINNNLPCDSLSVIDDIHDYNYDNVETVLERTVDKLSHTFQIVSEYEGMKTELESQLEELHKMVFMKESRIVFKNQNQLDKIQEHSQETSRQSGESIVDIMDIQGEMEGEGDREGAEIEVKE